MFQYALLPCHCLHMAPACSTVHCLPPTLPLKCLLLNCSGDAVPGCCCGMVHFTLSAASCSTYHPTCCLMPTAVDLLCMHDNFWCLLLVAPPTACCPLYGAVASDCCHMRCLPPIACYPAHCSCIACCLTYCLLPNLLPHLLPAAVELLCLVANLIYRKYIKGYIALKQKVTEHQGSVSVIAIFLYQNTY